MKHGHSFALGILALALIACGGDGGGGNSGSANGLTTTPRLEAVLSNQNLDPQYIYQDPLSIQTGDGVIFQLVNYTGSADNPTRNVLPVETFRTTDTSGVAGSFATDSGVFAAADADTGTRRYIVTARYNGQDYSTFYSVSPRQIRLRGKVLAEGTGNPVYNATVDFYSRRNPLDSTSQQVVIASVKTAVDGTFRVSIPAFNDQVDTVAEANDAPQITFTVRSSALPDGYYSSFLFKGARYDAGSTICRPTLLSNDIVTDPNTLEEATLPFKTGDRLLISADDADLATNGTILLAPRSLFNEKPPADGCGIG